MFIILINYYISNAIRMGIYIHSFNLKSHNMYIDD